MFPGLTSSRRAILAAAAVLAVVAGPASGAGPGLSAQDTGASPEADAAGDTVLVHRLVAEPRRIVVARGEEAFLAVAALDREGNPLSVVLRVAAPRSAVRFEDGRVRGLEVGEHRIVFTAVMPPEHEEDPPSVTVPVTVRWPEARRIEIVSGGGTLSQGVRLDHEARVLHGDGTVRPGARVRWSTSDARVATVDPYGRVTAVGTGTVTLDASFEGVRESITYRVGPFPGSDLEILGGLAEVRVGDPQAFRAVVRDEDGRELEDVPVTWSHHFTPHDSIRAPGGTAFQKGGRIVADVPGVYRVVATAGPLVAERTFEAHPRDVVQELEVVGQGRLEHVYTTDLWVFEGVDGRDYALTGSKYVGGKAFVWDVTDPSRILLTDSVQVDARTVNDVKVSPDGRWGALSREGASDRRNGVVILDLSDPAHPTVASTYEEGLTGGVHNMFATRDHLFALSDGDKYVILDLTDIHRPTYVSEYDHPDSRIHDVRVHDGIAYSAEWERGVVMVDVGNGRWGGSIENPVFINAFPLPSGRTHAVFPYRSESTGKLYLFVGDEILNRRGLPWQGTGPDYRQQYDPETGRGGYPRATSGYVQIVDLTDPEAPEMVARYQVPEYGTHNMWVEDDKLFQAYYEGGLRIVDVSGELMGNLYTQEREIAVHKAFDPLGYVPNSPGAWGAMVHKGHVFFSDINSGLWAVKLQPRDEPVM